MNRTKKSFDPLEQFFTDSETLKKIVAVVLKYVDTSFAFVDFSCGTNEFCHLLSQHQIPTESYDIDTSYVKYDESTVTESDWFDVTELPQGKVAVGLNPPFGFRAQTAIRFIKHALDISGDRYPEYFFLILPSRTKFPSDFMAKYDLVEQMSLNCNYYNVKSGRLTDFATDLFVFRYNSNKVEPKKVKSNTQLPEGFSVEPAKNKNEAELRKCLVMRINGRSSGSQYYLFERGCWVKYHKSERTATKCKKWVDLDFSLINFTSIRSPKGVKLGELATILTNWYYETYGENKGNNTHFHFNREDIRNVINHLFG
jgi:predicted RNA methylase